MWRWEPCWKLYAWHVQFLSNKWHGQSTLFASEYALCERRRFLFFSSCASAAAAAVANGEGRTHGVDWNDGSLCSVGRSDPVLSGPREDNVSFESARNKKRRAENGQRGGTRRRGSDVKWMSARRSAFVRSDRYDYGDRRRIPRFACISFSLRLQVAYLLY